MQKELAISRRGCTTLLWSGSFSSPLLKEKTFQIRGSVQERIWPDGHIKKLPRRQQDLVVALLDAFFGSAGKARLNPFHDVTTYIRAVPR
ncbi:MAG: hypothetical protein GY822_05480 [Deltaproteobacteria bacterium]|nr:hypothetical protein [Deltaproteobacteria bacterium]